MGTVLLTTLYCQEDRPHVNRAHLFCASLDRASGKCYAIFVGCDRSRFAHSCSSNIHFYIPRQSTKCNRLRGSCFSGVEVDLMVLFIGLYLLVGLIINYGSIFIIWGRLNQICKNNIRYKYLFRKHTQNALDFTPGFPRWAKSLFTLILWPLNVYNTLKCGLSAIKEANEDADAQ